MACAGSFISIDVQGEAETVIAEGTLLEELVEDVGFGEFLNMDITTASELDNQGVQAGDIQDAALTMFFLESTDPPGSSLSFLDSMELFVESPGLPRVLVASARSFPAGEARVAFVLEDVDLTDYVVSQSLTLTTSVTGRRPDVETTVRAVYRFSVGVTTQGACNFIRGESG